MKISNKTPKALRWLRVCSIIPMLGLPFFVNGQQASQGNTTVFGDAEITIFGAHDFIAGGSGTQPGIVKTIRTLPLGVLKFGPAASQTASNDANHVDGYVSKIGNTAFTFPTGNGTDLRTLSISAPSTLASQVTTAWFDGNPATVTDPSDGTTHNILLTDGTLLAVSPVGFWDWIPVAGTFAGLTITASIPDMATFAVPENLRLAGWDGAKWVNLSSGANASGNTEGSTLTGTIPATGSISALAIASTAVPLPVTLLSFSAKMNGGESASTYLEWATTTETNSDHFDVERSANGKTWNTIGRVNANGESSSTVKYFFSDEKPMTGENLYRLRMVDKDGTFAYSRIQRVTFENLQAEISVYPNPVADKLFVRDYSTVKEITVQNLNGAMVYQSASMATNNGYVDLSKLANGIYIVKISRENGIFSTHKVVVGK